MSKTSRLRLRTHSSQTRKTSPQPSIQYATFLPENESWRSRAQACPLIRDYPITDHRVLPHAIQLRFSNFFTRSAGAGIIGRAITWVGAGRRTPLQMRATTDWRFSSNSDYFTVSSPKMSIGYIRKLGAESSSTSTGALTKSSAQTAAI